MCRFLMIKSQKAFQPREVLMRFSEMARNSRALDGDWQGDGWGIGWIGRDRRWRIRKSIEPVWENEIDFGQIPESTHFVVHARSASFPVHKSNPDFNQPFNGGSYAFLFNGLIRGVSLPYPIPGEIGSQKIWHILNRLILQSSPEKAFSGLRELLARHSRSIHALNIGLSDGSTMSAFCYYKKYPEYYNLRYHESRGIKMVCSEPLCGYSFDVIPRGGTLIF